MNRKSVFVTKEMSYNQKQHNFNDGLLAFPSTEQLFINNNTYRRNKDKLFFFPLAISELSPKRSLILHNNVLDINDSKLNTGEIKSRNSKINLNNKYNNNSYTTPLSPKNRLSKRSANNDGVNISKYNVYSPPASKLKVLELTTDSTYQNEYKYKGNNFIPIKYPTTNPNIRHNYNINNTNSYQMTEPDIRLKSSKKNANLFRYYII